MTDEEKKENSEEMDLTDENLESASGGVSGGSDGTGTCLPGQGGTGGMGGTGEMGGTGDGDGDDDWRCGTE